MLSSAAGLGCATSSTLAARQFARDHGCSASHVVVIDEGGNSYLAEGCGRRARYVCKSFAGKDDSDNSDCLEQGAFHQAIEEPPKPLPRGMVEPPR